MTKEYISSFDEVIGRLLSVMVGAGISYWRDYTWGTGGDYDYWIVDNTGWYSGDVELKMYLRASRSNPTSVSIRGCSFIYFYDEFDKDGNYIGRKVSIEGDFSITSLSGTGTCYYSYAPRVAYLATPNSYVLFLKQYSIRGDMTEQMWTVNRNAYGSYPTVLGYAGFWRYTSDPFCIATSKIATPSKHTWNTYYNVYYCTASDWSVFSIPNRGYFFKVRGYNIALPADGDEGTYLGEAIEIEWEGVDSIDESEFYLEAFEIPFEAVDSIDEPEFYLEAFCADMFSHYWIIERREEIDKILQELIRENPQHFPQVGEAVLEKAKRVISKMTFE